MEARERLDGLDLDDDRIFNDDVEAITRIELCALINDGNRNLAS
jgi:hypothetical protein